MRTYELNILEKNKLVETASICAGNVSAVISNLIGGKKIELKVSKADIFPAVKVPELVAKGKRLVIGPKVLVVEIIAPLTGDLQGNMLTFFPQKNALLLLDLIKKQKPGTTKMLGPKEIVLLKKLGDDMLLIYTSQVKSFFGINLKKGSPKIVSMFGESLMDLALTGVDVKSTHVLMLRTDFTTTTKEINGSFILLLALKSLDKFIKILKKKVGEVE